MDQQALTGCEAGHGGQRQVGGDGVDRYNGREVHRQCVGDCRYQLARRADHLGEPSSIRQDRGNLLTDGEGVHSRAELADGARHLQSGDAAELGRHPPGGPQRVDEADSCEVDVDTDFAIGWRRRLDLGVLQSVEAVVVFDDECAHRRVSFFIRRVLVVEGPDRASAPVEGLAAVQRAVDGANGAPVGGACSPRWPRCCSCGHCARRPVPWRRSPFGWWSARLLER